MAGEFFILRLLFHTGKAVYNNTGERKERKKINKKYSDRSIVTIVTLYLIAFIICFSLLKIGSIGIILILIALSFKYQQLHKASKYCDVSRELKALLLMSIALFICGIIIYLPNGIHMVKNYIDKLKNI